MQLVVLLSLVVSASFSVGQLPADGWGPSWLGGNEPGGRARPDLTSPVTAMAVSGAGIGTEVRLWGDVGNMQPNHTYELRYQFRIHTKKGVLGNLLGTPAIPSGIAPKVAAGLGGKDWRGLEGTVDVYRRDLSGMTGLPEITEGFDQTVFLRVEPHLFDVTDNKYLTSAKSKAAVIVITVGRNRRVFRITPIDAWVAENCKSNSAKVAAFLNELDDFDADACGLGKAMLPTILDSKVEREVKVRLLLALPDSALLGKKDYVFLELLQSLSHGNDPELKRAADRLLNKNKSK